MSLYSEVCVTVCCDVCGDASGDDEHGRFTFSSVVAALEYVEQWSGWRVEALSDDVPGLTCDECLAREECAAVGHDYGDWWSALNSDREYRDCRRCLSVLEARDVE